MLNKKKAISTLFSSAVLLCLNAEVTKACVSSSRRNILLELPPTRLHEATFMGKVAVTRSTTLEYITLVRGVLKESNTHPNLVGNKVTFIHEGKVFDNLCPMNIRPGYEGYVIGREMKLNTDALIVDPYVADNFTWSIDETNIETGKGKFPLRHFYEPEMKDFY